MTSIVERLREPRKMANGLPVGECYGCYDAQRADAVTEIERLETALSFYADENNWREDAGDKLGPRLPRDGGKVAREALNR